MSENRVETSNKKVEVLEPADYGQYLLHGRAEMLQVLRQIQTRGSQITLFFNEGRDLILTTLIEVKDDGLIFDYGASAETNQRALLAEKLFGVTFLDKVRIQFIVRGLKAATHGGRPAFRAAPPDSVLRLQRREYYRLTMPLTRRLTCQIPLPEGQHTEVDIVDLSGGGLAMVAPHGSAPFESEMEFPNCRIELPEVGVVTATVKVLTTFEVTLRNGSQVKRAGCQFIGLPGPMATLIQRYIIKIERERKARESGLL